MYKIQRNPNINESSIDNDNDNQSKSNRLWLTSNSATNLQQSGKKKNYNFAEKNSEKD
jgi:hypothetical protein